MDFTKKKLWLLCGSLFLCIATPTAILWKKVDRVSKMERFIAKRQNSEILALAGAAATLKEVTQFLGKGSVALPKKLENIPCSERLGVVKKVREISIDSVFAPYNGSIIENDEGGYHLVFRYDEPKDPWKVSPFYTHIGYAELDHKFSVLRVVEKIDTDSQSSEDPRIVKVGEGYFLVWNDTIKADVYSRTMHTGKLRFPEAKLEYITNLDQRIKPVEKNWVPFESQKDGKSVFNFVYGVHPHKILELPSPEKNQIIHLPGKQGPLKQTLEWEKTWGSVYGGTQARLVNGEYISFFHSWFKEAGKVWYAMGAYTFEAKAPYKITSITPYPILFPGIYESSYINTADAQKHIIYPAGLALEEKGKKLLLHVSCGENDGHIKIVTFDYERLKKNMKLVN